MEGVRLDFMESLALLIAALMLLVIFTGPISLLLSSKFFSNFTRQNKYVWLIRRVFLVIVSLIGMSVEIIFIFNPLPLTPKLMAIIGFALNVIALKREFLRERKWATLFKADMGDQNGPPDQS